MLRKILRRTGLQAGWIIFVCEVKFFLSVSWFLVCAGAGNRYDFRARYPVPIFLTRDFNVTFTVGSTAVLNCSVANLGTRTVVWQKVPSENSVHKFPSKTTLTIGEYPFASDPSISIIHDPNKYNWDLRFDKIQLDDEGKYECQVSSSDKTLRQTVYVTVKEREEVPVKPLFNSENMTKTEAIQIYAPETVEKGEKLEIFCNATGTDTNQLDELDWFRNGYKVSTEFDKGVLIEKKFSLSKKKISSTLHIARAQMSDGGTYTCRTSGEQVKTVNIQVLTGDTFREIRNQDEETVSPVMLPGTSNNSQKMTGLSLQCTLIFIMAIQIVCRT